AVLAQPRDGVVDLDLRDLAQERSPGAPADNRRRLQDVGEQLRKKVDPRREHVFDRHGKRALVPPWLQPPLPVLQDEHRSLLQRTDELLSEERVAAAPFGDEDGDVTRRAAAEYRRDDLRDLRIAERDEVGIEGALAAKPGRQSLRLGTPTEQQSDRRSRRQCGELHY